MKQQKKLFVAAFMFIAGTSLFTACGEETFTDPRDGQKYKTVKIGEQVWMAEKLRYKGGAIEINEKEANYIWDSALVACPEGWRLPSKIELENVVSDTNFSRIWSATEVEETSLGAYYQCWNRLDVGPKKGEGPVRCIQGEKTKYTPNTINGFEAVRIGNQIWMAKNIDAETPNSVCYLEDQEECSKGRFYSISEATTICPEGWRLPNKKDAATLINKLTKFCGGSARSDCWIVRSFWGQSMGYYEDNAQFKNGTGSMIIGYWLLADGDYIQNHIDLEVESLYSWMKKAKFNVRCIADTEDKKEE